MTFSLRCEFSCHILFRQASALEGSLFTSPRVMTDERRANGPNLGDFESPLLVTYTTYENKEGTEAAQSV
jgi:hypothetical protein